MMTISRKISLATVLVVIVCLSSGVIPVAHGISIPFFGSFGSNRQQTTPSYYNEQKEPRIINSDHGGSGGALSPSSSSTASLAGGSFVGHSPWISGTRDQFIRDQLVILHPDSPMNRDVWKESGYLNSEVSPKDYGNNNEGMLSSARTPPARLRKPMRKSKQQTTATPAKTSSEGDSSGSAAQQPNNVNLPPPANGNFYEFLPTPMSYYRDFAHNLNSDMTTNDDDLSMIQQEPIFLPANNFLLPFNPIFPYSPRGIPSHATLPPEAVIQLLKSPEQEMSPLSRPQVKLPFPLSHDCSANNGGSSGSKPLQFVVLPIVEPVAPLKPIFPKPPFLSSQYGQFPYIPPFNYFNKKPPVFPQSNLDGSAVNNAGQGGGSSGQFVPILNRPAPPLPFVFVQSLPLELIGHNTEMDVLNSSPSLVSESKINEVSPIAAPPQQLSSSQQQVQSGPSPVSLENSAGSTRPLPLIVIEKVKTPGQPPSGPVAPAAAVVEISKQSLPKSGGGSGSNPLSTISVIKPITAPGSEPHTPQQQHEIHKTIEKLVPVAAAVLENVEQQLKQEKDGKDQAPSPISPAPPPVTPPGEQAPVSTTTAAKENEQDKSSSLRPPLRPDTAQETTIPQKVPDKKTETTSDEVVGNGVNPTIMNDAEIITEA